MDELKKIKVLAKFIHDKYEKLSVEIGWATQSTCKVKFDDLPKKNKRVMIGVATAIHQLIKQKELKARIDSSEKMLEIWTIDGCPNARGCKYINKLKDQLKKEGDL